MIVEKKDSFVAVYIKSSGEPVYFVTCRDAKDRPCFYVLMCEKYKLDLLLQAKEDVMDITKYAKVLASGFGTVPSAEVIKNMKQEYGLDLANLAA